jgi:hypothetical protein
MTPATRKVILHALASASANASDNLYRARRQFGDGSKINLDSEYGQSGMTCRQLLSEAEQYSKDIEAARAEVQAMP